MAVPMTNWYYLAIHVIHWGYQKVYRNQQIRVQLGANSKLGLGNIALLL